MIDTQAIRSKILDLAMRGKLTEQLPEDGTAEELYRQIQKEKQALIQAGKIKKEKPLPEITEDEVPFEIPSNWKWIRWGDIVNIVSARRVHQADWRKTGVPFYRAREIAKLAENGHVNNDLFISEELYKEFSKSGVPHENDLMVSAVGTLGRTYVVQKDDRFYYKDASVLCFENLGDLNPYFLALVMKSNVMRAQIESNSGGTTVDTLTMVRMAKYFFPLPPLAEQHRIVARIEQAFSALDTIDALQAKYADNLIVLKSKLIDAAIQGKLTEQLPEDGTAEELYQQIQTEKQALIQSGKIKKEKPLSELADNEVPFVIPNNWKWVRLGSIARVLGGKRIPAGRSLTQNDTGHKFIRVSDMKNRSVQTKSLLFVPEDIYPSISQYIINKEDVYITVAGTIGRVGKIPPEIDGANLTENADRIVFSYLDQDWLIFCLSSSAIQKQIELLTTSVAQPKLAIQRIQDFQIPLPPFAEQKRIVERLTEILAVCDELK